MPEESCGFGDLGPAICLRCYRLHRRYTAEWRCPLCGETEPDTYGFGLSAEEQRRIRRNEEGDDEHGNEGDG